MFGCIIFLFEMRSFDYFMRAFGLKRFSFEMVLYGFFMAFTTFYNTILQENTRKGSEAELKSSPSSERNGE